MDGQMHLLSHGYVKYYIIVTIAIQIQLNILK